MPPSPSVPPGGRRAAGASSAGMGRRGWTEAQWCAEAAHRRVLTPRHVAMLLAEAPPAALGALARNPHVTVPVLYQALAHLARAFRGWPAARPAAATRAAFTAVARRLDALGHPTRTPSPVWRAAEEDGRPPSPAPAPGGPTPHQQGRWGRGWAYAFGSQSWVYSGPGVVVIDSLTAVAGASLFDLVGGDLVDRDIPRMTDRLAAYRVLRTDPLTRAALRATACAQRLAETLALLAEDGDDDLLVVWPALAACDPALALFVLERLPDAAAARLDPGVLAPLTALPEAEQRTRALLQVGRLGVPAVGGAAATDASPAPRAAPAARPDPGRHTR